MVICLIFTKLHYLLLGVLQLERVLDPWRVELPVRLCDAGAQDEDGGVSAEPQGVLLGPAPHQGQLVHGAEAAHLVKDMKGS